MAISQINAFSKRAAATNYQNDLYQSDHRLLQMCWKQEEDAWLELVNRYSRLVYSIPRVCGLETADAEQVHENVFNAVLQNLPRLHRAEKFHLWLIDCAHVETIRVLRKQRQENSPQTTMTLAAFENELRSLETAELVRITIHFLPLEEKELLQRLLAQRRPSLDEIAETTNSRASELAPVLARAVEHLDRLMSSLDLASIKYNKLYK